MTTEKKHALLGPSGAKKWLNCPGSARLEESIQDAGSDFADEGTLAHELCELKLRRQFIEPGMPKATYTRKINKIKKSDYYNQEMESASDFYLDYISQIAYAYPETPYITAEKQVRYDTYVPEGFGTADCIIISGRELHVVDFKYGKGVHVSATMNPQMMLYALGAYLMYSMLYPIETIHMHIVQPRVSTEINWDSITLQELLAWAENTVKPAAQKAWDGIQEYHQGEWCDSCFCRAAGSCRKRAEENLQQYETAQKPIGSLSTTEIGEALTKGRFVAAWLKKLEKLAAEQLAAGHPIPGWKLVEGRSNRVFSDVDACFDALAKGGVPDELLYKNVPATITELEKALPPEQRKLMQPFIQKPPGAPTLAPENDKRQPYQVVTAESAFGGNNAL